MRDEDMNPGQVVVNYYLESFRKYAVFRGRASRLEYWLEVLISAIIAFVLVNIDKAIGTYDQRGNIGLLEALYALFAFVPTWAVSVRRLHDTNRTGWWLLIGLIPVVGWLVLIVFYVQAGTPGSNSYGPNPKTESSERQIALRERATHRHASGKRMPPVPAAIPVPITFSLLGTKMGQLGESGWFDCTRFSVVSDSQHNQNSREVLCEFLRDPISNRSFLEQDTWGSSCGHHGPFITRLAAAAWFEQLSATGLTHRALEVIAESQFASQTSAEQRFPIEMWLNTMMTRGDEVFELVIPNLPGTRIDQDAWLLYREFLCFSRDHKEITVAVIGESRNQ